MKRPIFAIFMERVKEAEIRTEKRSQFWNWHRFCIYHNWFQNRPRALIEESLIPHYPTPKDFWIPPS